MLRDKFGFSDDEDEDEEVEVMKGEKGKGMLNST
jgi:hypothetical protein